MNKIIRCIAILLAVICMAAGGVACSEPEPADKNEVIESAKTLLTEAVEVNRIFFWEGLPHTEPSEDTVDVGDAEYLELTEEYVYLIESDLMTKAEAVYTDAYCKDIETVAFEGVKVSDDEALFARYVVEQGVMKINRKLSEEGLSERLPDTDTIQVVEVSHDYAVVNLSFTCEGETEKQNVTLILEDDGWRLDTPTY